MNIPHQHSVRIGSYPKFDEQNGHFLDQNATTRRNVLTQMSLYLLRKLFETLIMIDTDFLINFLKLLIQ